MILDCKARTLNSIRLTNVEFRFISCLASGKFITYKTIKDYVYDEKLPDSYIINLKTLKYKLHKKTGVDIRVIFGVGYTLNTIIEIM